MLQFTPESWTHVRYSGLDPDPLDAKLVGPYGPVRQQNMAKNHQSHNVHNRIQNIIDVAFYFPANRESM